MCGFAPCKGYNNKKKAVGRIECKLYRSTVRIIGVIMFDKKKKSGKIPLMKVAKAKRGNTLQTRDEYLAGQKGKNIKPKHPNKNDLYRTGVIIRVNNQDEYAIVPLTTKKKIKLDEYYDKKTYAKDMIEIFDCDGKPIKQNDKFVVNKDKRKILSENDLSKIEKFCLEQSKRKQHNQKQIRRFDDRDKK